MALDKRRARLYGGLWRTVYLANGVACLAYTLSRNMKRRDLLDREGPVFFADRISAQATIGNRFALGSGRNRDGYSGTARSRQSCFEENRMQPFLPKPDETTAP